MKKETTETLQVFLGIGIIMVIAFLFALPKADLKRDFNLNAGFYQNVINENRNSSKCALFSNNPLILKPGVCLTLRN